MHDWHQMRVAFAPSVTQDRVERAAREGERLSTLDYVAAEAARATYAADVDAFFTSVELFVTPTMSHVTPRID